MDVELKLNNGESIGVKWNVHCFGQKHRAGKIITVMRKLEPGRGFSKAYAKIYNVTIIFYINICSVKWT